MNSSEIQSLSSRGTFLHRAISGRLEETHISWVILTKKYAFKIKKPLKLSFLDFSTLEKRRHYCNRELQLNRRYSAIYLDVLPVYKNGDSWSIGEGSGRIREYALQMKRLKGAKRMDKLLEKKVVSQRSIRSLARVVAAFHSEAQIVKKPFQLSNARETFNDVASIISLARTHLGTQAVRIIKNTVAWSNAFLKSHARRLRERASLGFKRDVHGDLHSGNIFLYRTPVIFDCIEFNDDYRRIDVINEIAFFCMDLEAFHQQHLANVFLNNYLQQQPCLVTSEDDCIFVYYKCYRANVRAKIHAIRTASSIDKEDYRHHLKAWRNYLRLMQRYMNKIKM
jgi:uncharacterized protein